MKNMHLEHLILGNIFTNVYFVRNEQDGRILLIDPADNAPVITKRIHEMGGNLQAILLTHGHYDHFGAAEAVRKTFDVPVYCGEDEQEVLSDPDKNTSWMHGVSATLKADVYVHDGVVLDLAGFRIQVIGTPGHTVGGCCYYFPDEKVLFSGDTLFCESYGRTDFPTGSGRQMQESVHRLLRELPPDTQVFPGHEAATTIAHEQKFNPLA